MTPERWRHITELFHAARAHDPVRRGAFLARACREDPTLRQEVEAMLAGHDQVSPLDADRQFATALSLQPGFALGPYRLECLIGAGGMGEVYRARDTKLGRDVAVKTLPPEFTSDPERLARFEREARILAALNNPHIATIYGLEEADGVRGLVLELVEGPTLRDRLADGPLHTDEALSVARQIAEALEAAHEKGIVHRDLKPANIKITPEGVVKVLDFGLAKAGVGDGSGPDLSNSPTLTAGGTREGLILGTAAYMSPEQARGRPVDKRADIWAFGCVLYEMLTGRNAFDADTAQEAVAKILEREPDWNALPGTVPDTIRRLLKRCLQKDPSERLHDIADARLDVVEAQFAPGVGQSPPIRRRRGLALWVALAGTAGAFTLALWMFAGNRNQIATSTGVVEFSVGFPEGAVPSYGLAVSPDGRHAAVSAIGDQAQLWLYSLDSPELRKLPGPGTTPFWSPDGLHIGFFGSGKLKRIDLAGGPAVDLADVKGAGGGSWNADGVIVFSNGSDLFRVSASGGTPVPLVVADRPGEPAHRIFPQFLPDNHHFIYYLEGQHGGVYVGSLDSDQSKHLLDSDYPAAFAPPAYLLFLRGTALMSQVFDLKTLDLNGQPSLVAPDVAPGFLDGNALFSASETGVLTFVKTRAGRAGQLTWFDRAGKALGSIPQPLGEEYLNPAISPNGELVAANRMDPQTGNWDIWLVDVSRGIASRFTSNPARDADPVWSPDGKEIVFASDRDGQVGLYRESVDSSKPAELLLKIEGNTTVIPTDWSRDWRYILYSQLTPRFAWSLWALPLFGDRTPFRVTNSALSQYDARFSPDSQWVAYEGSEAGVWAVYVQRFLVPGDMKQVSGGGSNHPRWTAGGRELVYWVLGRGLESVDLTFTASGVRASAPRTLIATPILGLIDSRTAYDATPDGQRFLLRQPAGPPGPATMTVMLNWKEKLKR